MVDVTRAAPGGEALAVAASSDRSYVDWAAVLAGAFVAAAVAFVLGTFGAAIGLSLISPFGGESAPGILLLIAVGLWTLWVAASSYMAGGYIAGRMRRRLFDSTEHESDVRDSAHGIVVWAVGTLVGAFLAAGALSGAAVTGIGAVATVASGAVQGAGAAADESGSDPLAYLLDRMMRPAPASAGPSASAGATAAPAPSATEGTGSSLGATALPPPASMSRPGPSERMAERAPGLRGEAGTIVRRSVLAGEDMSDEDRSYLGGLVARETGLSEEEAAARVDAAMADAQAAVREMQEAAEVARKTGIVAAFLLAASLLVGAAGAAWGAGLGGRHRDEGLDLTRWFPRR